MLTNYEEVSELSHLENDSVYRGIEDRDNLTSIEYNYLEEVMPYRDGELIAARIDELCGCVPPKGIDANKEVASIIESMRDDIDPIYLEAPSDSVQITESVDALNNIEGVKFEEWVDSSIEQRIDTLQTIENTIAEIAHRPGCQLNVRELSEGNYGYFNPENKEIVVNSLYIYSDDYRDYRECLDTIVHEGRHAYQDYNMTEREVHPRGGEVDNWRLNSKIGYLDACEWGLELYQYQPLESDARAFAGDVIDNYFRNTIR